MGLQEKIVEDFRNTDSYKNNIIIGERFMQNDFVKPKRAVSADELHDFMRFHTKRQAHAMYMEKIAGTTKNQNSLMKLDKGIICEKYLELIRAY